MSRLEFTHLHGHTTYSLGDATTLIPDLCRRVKEQGGKACAITDHGTMAGIVEFMKECKRTKYPDRKDSSVTVELPSIKPILGMEAYIALKSAKSPKSFSNPTGHIILLARNREGYANLCALLREATLPENFSYTPRIDMEMLSRYSKGLIGLTACVGGLPQKYLLGWNYYDRETKTRLEQEPLVDKVRSIIDSFRNIFDKDCFFLEVQNHKFVDEDKKNSLAAKELEDYEWMVQAQSTVAKAFLNLSIEMRVPAVMTNDFHYLGSDMMDTRQAILAIDGRGKLDTVFDGAMADATLLAEREADERGVHEITGQLYVKSPEEMAIASHNNDYPYLMKNTMAIAAMCDTIDLSPPKDEKGKTIWNLPTINVGTKTMKEALIEASFKGFEERYPDSIGPERKKVARDRYDYEIGVMDSLGLVPYHLMVQDMVKYAKSNGIRVGPGRGSGAGSIVVYCLGITDLDPIRHSLLFERYLNPERASAADLDVDFDPRRVNEVYQYVVSTYGTEQVARISSYGSLHAKGSIRRLARAMCLNREWVDDISERLPEDQGEFRVPLSRVLEDGHSHAANAIKKFIETGGPVAEKFFTLATKLDDVKISRGQHAAGIVVSGTPLKDIVPLVLHDREDLTSMATEIPFEFLEELGLLKQDLLVVDGLAIIDMAIKFIRERHDPTFELKTEMEETYDDPTTLDIFSRGDLAGIWQMSSHGMRELCVSLQPSNLDDIAAACALYRPGPLDFIDHNTGYNMVETYIRRKKGLLPIKYDHPLVEDALRSTYGVIVFQEQIMQIARSLCGWSYAQADYLRKAVGKKLPEEIEKQKKKFIPAAQEHSKLDNVLVNRIWDQIETFGRYGFNAAHSYAYGKLSYQMAYIKGKYPAEFLAAAINSACDKGDKAKRVGLLHDFVDEALRKGIKVYAPDVINSKADTIPEGVDAIRLGFNSIRGVSSAAQKIETAQVTPEMSLAEVIRTVYATGVNKTALKGLASAGAFDRYGERNFIVSSVEHMADLKSKKSKKRVEEYFGLKDESLPVAVAPATAEDKDIATRETLYLVPTSVAKPLPKDITVEVTGDVEPLLKELKTLKKGDLTLHLYLTDRTIETQVSIDSFDRDDIVLLLDKYKAKVIGVV